MTAIAAGRVSPAFVISIVCSGSTFEQFSPPLLPSAYCVEPPYNVGVVAVTGSADRFNVAQQNWACYTDGPLPMDPWLEALFVVSVILPNKARHSLKLHTSQNSGSHQS